MLAWLRSWFSRATSTSKRAGSPTLDKWPWPKSRFDAHNTTTGAYARWFTGVLSSHGPLEDDGVPSMIGGPSFRLDELRNGRFYGHTESRAPITAPAPRTTSCSAPGLDGDPRMPGYE